MVRDSGVRLGLETSIKDFWTVHFSIFEHSTLRLFDFHFDSLGQSTLLLLDRPLYDFWIIMIATRTIKLYEDDDVSTNPARGHARPIVRTDPNHVYDSKKNEFLSVYICAPHWEGI